MHKFSALYKNELIKTARKPIFIVMISLVVVSMITFASFMEIIRSIDNRGFNGSNATGSPEDTVRHLEESVEKYREKLEKTFSEYESVLKEAYDPETKSFGEKASQATAEVLYEMDDTFRQIHDAEYQIAIIKIEEKTGRKYNSGENTAFDNLFSNMMYSLVCSDFGEAFTKIYNEIMARYPMAGILDNEYHVVEGRSDTGPILPKDVYNKYLDMCTKGDSAAVFESKREAVRESEAGDVEKKIRLESIDTIEELFRADMPKTAWNEIETNIDQLNTYKMMAETGKDNRGRKLSDDRIKEASLAVSEIEALLKAGAPGYGGKYTQEDKLLGTILIEIGVAVSQILVIVVGAVIVAADFQTGAIKTIIIAPVKRRRIVSAKFCMLLTVWLACMVLVFISYMLAAPISGSDFGNNVFVLGGSVVTLNPFLYYMLYVFILFIPVLFHGCFAFMLSTLVRNTGGSISISMATVYVINANAAAVIALISSNGSYFFRHLMGFLPSSNLNLSKLFFGSYVGNGTTSPMNALSEMLISGQKSNSPLFAFIYLALLSALFVFISYQSYTKRDIK